MLDSMVKEGREQSSSQLPSDKVDPRGILSARWDLVFRSGGLAIIAGMSTISRKLCGGHHIAASYFPPLVGFDCGVGHCDVCRQAWLKLVWIVQGTLLSELFQRFLSLPRVDIDSTWGYAIAVVLQLDGSLVGVGSQQKVTLG